MGPGALSDTLRNLPNLKSDRLLIGYDTSDDACVYKLNNDTAVIQTVDFFTPVADDPYIFGQIAAANSLSDVYAMGGRPALAMNLLCVPNCLSTETVREILRGGHDKAVEAGCVIAGGHTIEDKEPKYGMSVMGLVHPERIWRNAGAMPGDILILTKPLGSGILVTSQKGGLASPDDYRAAVNTMCHLNKYAAESLSDLAVVHACTDVTGFGLLGHAYEMASGSGVSIELDSAAIPVLSGAMDMAEIGLIPAGAYRNRNYVMPHCTVSPKVSTAIMDILCDPQTSGGLLLSVPREESGTVLARLRSAEPASSIIGYVRRADESSIIIK